MRIDYDPAIFAPNTITEPSTLTTSEADIYKILNVNDISQSQITLYFKVTLGAVTSATFYAYYSIDGGSTWYPTTVWSSSTGELTQQKFLIDSGSYALSSVSYATYNLAMGACNAFKVTGLSSSGTPAYSVGVAVRNN